MRETISLLEGAELDLKSAEVELAHSRGDLQEFIRINCFTVDDMPVLVGNPARRSVLEAEMKQL